MTVKDRFTAMALGHAHASMTAMARAYQLLLGVPGADEKSLERLSDAYSHIGVAIDAIEEEIAKDNRKEMQ